MNTLFSRTLWGIAILALGVGFLLNSLGIANFTDIIATFWPALVILAGVLMYIGNRKNYLIPGFIVLVGLLFQLERLELINLNVGQIIWPAAIIFVGLTILFQGKSAKDKSTRDSSNDPKTDLFAALSGIENKVTSKDYRGGSASAVLGGIGLDLRKADIKGSANLSLFTFCGGIELSVPETWRVNVTGTPLLGGWENRATEPTDKNAPVLNIDATCMLGGIEIKN